MNEYRAYLIGPDGHFVSGDGFEAADDDAAIEIAKRFARLGDVEVWQGARKVRLIAALEGDKHDQQQESPAQGQ